MEKMNKFQQLVKATVLLLLLLLIPFVSSSMRPSYLYFLLNILILSLGIEAGFLAAAISNDVPREDQKPPIATTSIAPFTNGDDEIGEKKEEMMAMKKLKKCPSVPSHFFNGGHETEEEEEMRCKYEEEEEEEEVMVGELGDQLSAQELFSKAEMFISNFYKQQKMQREESWKRIHGFYRKAF